MLDGVGGFESVKELQKHVLLGLLSRQDIGMLLGVVCSFDVVDIQDTAAVLIYNAKRFLNEVLASCVHWTYDLLQELVVVDGAATTRVEGLEDGLVLSRLIRDSVVSQSLREFLRVQASGAIVIYNLEGLSETDNSPRSAGSDLISDFLNHFGVCSVFELVCVLGRLSPLAEFSLHCDTLV